MIRRRKRPPPALERSAAAFGAVVAELDAGARALTAVMPTTRLPGRPLPDALLEFEERLGRAADLMPAWRHDDVGDAWERCRRSLDEALDRARRLREDAPALGGFEALVWAVGELLAPLEPFEDAAARLRELRRRG